MDILAHGGVGGAIVELLAALAIVAVAVSAWVVNRRDRDGDAPGE